MIRPFGALRTFATTLVLTSLLGAPPARSAEPQAILARGFEPDQIYDFNDVDHVNLFNGNLVVTIPIGQRYPLGGGFDYGFALVYNSHIWEYVIDCPGDGSDEFGEPGAPILFITDPVSAARACDPTDPTIRALRGIPNPKSNAGTGWRLSLGELYDVGSPLVPGRGWTFVGPDGAERAFSPPEGATANFPQFTRDGSHLRLNNSGAASACDAVANTCMTVERPDGVVYAFESAPTLAGWKLRRIEDRFGNHVTIDDSGGSWTVTDSATRSHSVTFDSSGMVLSVDLEAFNQTRARFDFTTTLSPELDPGCPHDFPGPPFGEQITWLTSVSLPDGSRYVFDYWADDGATGDCSRYAGRLRSTTLPTGGRISYEYAQYLYPIRPCDPPPLRSGGSPSDFFMAQWGVARRSAVDVDGTTLLAETRYVHGGPLAAPTRQAYTASDGTEICIQPRTTFTDVYEKADQGRHRLTRHFFAIAQSQGGPNDPTDPDRLPGETFRYGLPVDHLTPDTEAGNPSRYRSSMAFDCPSAPAPFESYGPNCATEGGAGCWPADAWHLQVPPSCHDADPIAGGQQRFLLPTDVRGLRDTYLEHEQGNVHYCNGGATTTTDCDRSDHRVRSDITYYHQGSGWHVATSRSQFDGFGHYEHVRFTSNSPFSPARETIVRYAPQIDASTWHLDVIESRTVQENGRSSTERFVHTAENGFVERRTVERPAGYLVVDFTNDGFGNAESETYSGGDPGQPGYTVANEFRDGVLAKSEYRDGAAALLRTIDADIDPSTGLPSASRDISGLETVYAFDVMGRLTSLVQQGSLAEDTATYTYDPAGPPGATTAARASVVVTRGDTSSTIFFDGLGRAQEVLTLLPGGTTNRRFTTFTPMGRLSTVTTLHDEAAKASARKTTTEYDVFGRPTKILRPDHGLTASGESRTTFSYDGIFKTTRRIFDVATPDGPLVLQTRFLHDHQGRLVRVEDTDHGAEPGSKLILGTTYSYDEGGRLVKVSQAGGAQFRTFDYDEAGLLTRECHPELASGCITYAGFDARGNASQLRYTRAGGEPFGLDFTRDAAERVTQVRAADDGRLLQELFYNDFYGVDDPLVPAKGSGKLYQAKRHNPLGTLDLVATTTHTYAGVGGRLSERVVTTGGDGDLPRVRFATSFTYDGLGNLSNITYPACGQTGCDEAELPARTVRRAHTRGLLSAVGTAVDPDRYAAFAYHPNLTLDRIDHGNGVVDDVSQDPSQISRPGGIEVRTGATAGSGALWQASYAYDGSGNLTSRATSGFTNAGAALFAGTDLFRYDPVFNRLLSSTLHYPAGAGGAVDSRSFAYDPFGNLTAVTGASPRTLTPDPETNRLPPPFTYDTAGNLTSQPAWDASGNPTGSTAWIYSYDPLSKMTRATNASGSVERRYLYTADGERLATLSPGRELWTLRGTGNEVLRDVEYLSTGWSWLEDYIHGGPGLLATENASETKHYHLDHLGSPRLVTDGTKQVLARHVHAPYGEELTSSFQDGLRVKFTGHERDVLDPFDAGGELDYMHARYYSGSTGRFLSVDPKNRYEPQRMSQRWNRYAYASSSPIVRIDPDGRVDRRSDEDRKITENPVVLKTSSQLIASTSSGSEYGALVGEKSNGDFVASGIYTSNHPGQVSHLQAIERDKSGNVTIKGTGVAPTRTLHTHLTSGKAYPVPGTNQTLTPTATDEPSTNDKVFAQGTGVAGYIIVPSAKVLVKVNTDGTYEVILSERDYRRWAKRTHKAK